MDRTRSFKVGTDIYDIPESKAQEFLNSVKDKSVEEILTFDVDKDKYDIPVQKVKIFLQSTPFAKPSYDYPALDTLVTEKSKFDQYNKSQSRVTPQSDTFRSQTIDPNAVAYKQENKEDYDTLPTDFGTGWKSGVENLKGGIKYLGGVVGETIDKLDGEDEMQWDNRLMESARKNFENAPRGKGIWYEFGTFAPQMIGIAAATATAPLTAGTSLAVIPGVIGGGNIAMLVGSASGSAMYEYDRYMDEKGEKSNSLARLGVGIGSGAAEYLAERIGLDRYMPKGSMARAFSKFLSKNTDVAEKIGKEVVQKAPLLREFGKKTIKNAVEEGSEEVITEIGNIAIESIYRDKDDIASAEEIVSRLGSAFKGGAMMGGVISPLTFAADRAYQDKMGKNDQPQVPTVPPNSPQGGIDPEVQAVIDRERGIYEGLLNEQDNDQNKPMYQERLDQLNNDPLGYFTLALQKKELLNKSNPSESRQKQIEELKGIISKLQPANAAPSDPMQQVKTEAEQDFDRHIHKESGNNIFVNHAKLGPIRLSMADIDQAGNITSETGEVFAWDPNSPGNQIPIPLNEIIGKPVIVSRDQYLSDATMKAQTAQAEQVAVDSNSYTDETGQRWMITGQQDEKGNPLVAMVDGNNRPTAQIKPVTQDQLDAYMQKKQVEEQPVPEGEQKPAVKTATWGKTQYQYKSNPDGTADVLIPNKVPAAKAFDEISKHFANNTRFTVVPVKEKKLITDPNDEFADPVEQEVTTGVKIVPKEMAPATPDQAQPEGKGAKTTAQPQQKQVQASYTFGKDKIERDEAAEIINIAESYEDIKDLKLEGDQELQNLIQTKFPPSYTIAGQPATPTTVKANIRLGKNLDQITIENDSELSNLLDSSKKKFAKIVNISGSGTQKVNQNETTSGSQPAGTENQQGEISQNNIPGTTPQEQIIVNREDFPFLNDAEFTNYTDPNIPNADKAAIIQKINTVSIASSKQHKSGKSVKDYIDSLYNEGYRLNGMQFVAKDKPSVELGNNKAEKDYALLIESLQPAVETEEGKIAIPQNPKEEREVGYKVQKGTRYDRQKPVSNKVEGNETALEFSTNSKAPKGKWTVMEAGEIQPSHLGQVRNPLHFIAEAQPKERTDAVSEVASEKIADRLSPEKITNKTTNAYYGAPTVNSRGEVIQGNNRAVSLQKYWSKFASDPNGYRQYLIDHAEEMGLNPEKIAAMKSPVLVNMVDVTDEEAIALGQFKETDLTTGGIQRIPASETARKVADKLPAFIEMLTKTGDQSDLSLRETIKANALTALKYLHRLNAINDTQYQSALRNNEPSSDAVDDLQELMTFSLFEGARADLNYYFDMLPHNIKMGIIKSIPVIVKEGGLRTEIHGVIMANQHFNNSPWRDSGPKAVPAWSKNVDMMNPVPPEAEFGKVVVSLLQKLLETKTQKDVVLFFTQYDQTVNGVQGLMPEPALGKTKAIEKLLNVPENEQGGIAPKLRPNSNATPADGRGTGDAAGQSPGEVRGTTSQKDEDGTPAGEGERGQGQVEPPSDTTTDIAAKKADIERRREKELSKTIHGVTRDFYEDWKKVTGENWKKADILRIESESNEVKEYFENNTIDKINAKYDAELAALTPAQKPAQPTFELVKKRVIDHFGGMYEDVVKSSPEYIYENIPEATPEMAKKVYDAIKTEYEAEQKKQKENQDKPVFGWEVAQEAEKVNQNPSPAQKEAGKYKKGHVTIQGMDISIKNPAGSKRRGTDPDGNKWERTMTAHYGDFNRTNGKDGDQIDVFINPDNPESEVVFVVDQDKPGKDEFDESKVMLGYKSYQEAKEAYLSNYEDGWINNVRAITEVPLDKFKKWLYDGARQRKPFGEYKDTPAPVVEQQTPEIVTPLEAAIDEKDPTFKRAKEDFDRMMAGSKPEDIESAKIGVGISAARFAHKYTTPYKNRGLYDRIYNLFFNGVKNYKSPVVKKNLTTEKELWEMTRDEFIQEKELKQAESNKLDTPTENIYKVGDRYIEFGNDPYVFELRNVNPNDIDYSEKWQSEEAVLGRDDVQQYIKWFKEGKQPMPISVVFNKDRKEYISSNRRRLLAARNSGVKTIPAWVEVGKHRDLIQQALSEGKPVPENILKDYPELKKQEPDIDNAIKVAKSQNEINWDNKPEQEPAKPEADENNVFDEDHVSRNLDDYKNEPEKEKAIKFIKSNLFDAIGERDLLGSTPERVKRIANLTELIKRIEGLRESPKEYRYKMLLRPFGISTHPKEGFVKADQDPEGGFQILTYDRKLDRKQWNQFSLLPITEIEEIKGKGFKDKDGEYTVSLKWENNNQWAEVTMQDKNGDLVSDPYDMSYMDILENIETGYWVENKKSDNFVQNGNNEVPESVPQGERRAQDEESGGMAKESGSRIRGLQATIRDARKDSEGLSDREITDKVEKAITKYAKENGIWFSLNKVSDLGSPFPSGNESEVFYNEKDGFVYKVNNLTNTGSVQRLIDAITEHNKYFPETSYEIHGFTGTEGKTLFPILKQRYINSNTVATPDEIGDYMKSLGFEKTGNGKYSNGEVTISDLFPRNVLKDASGDVFVIDNIIKSEPKEKPQRFDEGKKLTEEEKREVYRTLKDAYKVNNRPRTLEDQGQGERWLWLENASDYMVTSDITGSKLRWFVTLPDGKIAHPTELWPSMDRAEIERVQDSIEKQGYYAEKRYNETLGELKKNNEVDSIWDNIDKAIKAGAEFVKEYSAEDRGQRDPNVYLRWKHLPGNTPIPDYHLRMEGSTFAGMNQAQYIKAKETGNKWTRWENANIDWERFYNENKPLQTPLEKAISQNPVLKLESPESIEKLEDFGDKIGGARKDMGITRTVRDEESLPAWRRKYYFIPTEGKIGPEGKIDTTKPFFVVYDVKDSYNRKFPRKITSVGKYEPRVFTSEEEAEAYIPIFEVGQQRFRIRKGEAGFKIVRVSSTKKLVEYATFPTEEEANAYMYSTEGATSLLNHRREDFSIPKLDKVERNGKDWRKGKDVTTDEFMNTFGFRGGEFGNWVKPEERRVMLNAAYDSFMDLSELLNIPPRAVSLGGELAIAFGARGIKGAAAHFEPDRAVINMTRMNGAGSLAHEWAHAMDSYFGMQEAKSSYEKNEKGQLVNGGKFLSEDKTYKAGMRKELSKIFDEIVSATQSKSVTRVMGVEEKQKLFDLNSKLVNEESNHIIKKFEKGIIRYLYNRKTKQREETLVKATPEQLEKVKEVVDKIRNGEGTAPDWNRIPGSKGIGEYSYISPETLALEELHKEVFGKSGLKRDGNGFFNLGYYANKMYPAKKAFEKAKAGETETVNVKTDYLKNSIKFDASRSGPYFQKKVEMFARAFEYFIEQKLLDKNQRADYLQYDKAPVYEAIYGMSPYPAGEERAELNKLFQKFFDEVKVVDKGGVSFMQRVVSTIGYYSTVEDALDKITQGKGTPEQFKAMLLKNGAKQAEMDWMDFDGSFADKKSVTKAEIQEWIDQNKIEVEEVQKGTFNPRAVNKSDVKSVRFKQFGSGSYVVSWNDPEIGDIEISTNEAIDEEEAIEAAIERANYDNTEYRLAKPKYSQYTLPGGENYKELLLTMPVEGIFDPSKVRLNRIIHSVTQGSTQVFYDGKLLGTYEDNPKLQEDSSYKQLPDSEWYKVAERRVIKGDMYNKPIAADVFASAHWEEPNILAHIRFDERVTPDGEKVLFIEEIQSDWAQKGKKEGFKEEGYIQKRKEVYDKLSELNDIYSGKMNEFDNWVEKQGGFDKAKNKYGIEKYHEIRESYTKEARENYERQKNIAAEIEAKISAAPDMPFKKTDQWVNLALRRMMRYAAEHGFDRIAWTTGEQQADRYDLSKQISSIQHSANGNGTYNVFIKDRADNEVMDRLDVPVTELEGIVGKEITNKIINREGETVPGRDYKEFRDRGKATGAIFKNNGWYITWENGSTSGVYVSEQDALNAGKRVTDDYVIDSERKEPRLLTGLDLKVGGEGMKAFYDKIIPSAASKLGKPFGAKLEPVTITGSASYEELVKAGEQTGLTQEELDKLPIDERVKLVNSKLPTVQSIPVTESMKETAMNGVPLFSVVNHKKQQFEVIQSANPAQDDIHTWIRDINEIQTLEEAIKSPEWNSYEEYNPDWTAKNANKAIRTGKVTVYSSKPIEAGSFVTPSKMEAQSYSGDGKVYSQEVNTNDVAWIDPTQGQYAPAPETFVRVDDIETIRGAIQNLQDKAVNAKPLFMYSSEKELEEHLESARIPVAAAKKVLSDGKTIGFYDEGRGVVFIDLRKVGSIRDGIATWVHEMGLHAGLRNIIPGEQFDSFMEDIYNLFENNSNNFDENTADKASKAAKIAYDAVMGSSSYDKVSKAKKGEEMIAYFGERYSQSVGKGDTNLEDKGIFRQIVEKITNLLRKVFGLTKKELTLEDVELIVRGSIRSMFASGTRPVDAINQAPSIGKLRPDGKTEYQISNETEYPLSEKEFYKKYKGQHKDIRSKGNSLRDVQQTGFKSGAWVLPIYKGGKPTNIVEKTYGPKKGDFIYIVPKEWVKDTPGGWRVKEGWKPQDNELVEIAYDNQPIYEAYTGKHNGTPDDFTPLERAINKAVETRGKMVNVDGVMKPTTNSAGNPIAPTLAGIRNFYKWFGDSKVVDEQGRPLVVYHGTKSEFTEFRESPGNIWFTPNRNYAEAFGNVGEYYVRLLNPVDNSPRYDPNSDGTIDRYPTWKDGVIGEILAVSVKSPSQIKSATGNNGNFDPDDFNILRRTTQEGEKQLSLFDEPKTLPDGEGETYTTKKGEKIRYRSLSPDNWPVSGKIREKKDYIPGDDDIFCAIEREITESKIVELTGTDKIESPADVAYLFRHLESAASENAFVVHHLKGGGYVVQYISSGSTSGTVVDSKLIVAAAKEFGSAAITFVHNHPSGNLQASDADKKMHAMIRKACEGVCEMNPSVIIDLDKGEYGVFEEYWNVSEKTENDRKTASVKVPVYSFDKQVLYEKSDTWTQITGPDSVAKYLSKIKRGTGKYIVIIMNRNNRITRTFLSTTFPRKEDIIPMVGKHGDSVIIASPIKESDRVMSLSKSMEDTGVKLIDWIEIESDPGIIKSYKSAADEGLIRDPNTVYGYQPTEFEVNDPTPPIVTPLENVVQNAADRYAENRAIKRTWNEVRDQMIQFWKDVELPIKRLQEAIVSLGGKLTDNSQPYRAIDLAKGRLEHLFKRYIDKKFNPLLKAVSDIRKMGISGADILPYMISKHALERNPDLRNKELNELVDKFKRSNPDATLDEINVFTYDIVQTLENKDYSGVMPFDQDGKGDSINGFTDPEELAQAIVDEFEARFDTPEKKRLLDKLWEANHEAGQETLKIWKESNSMSEEEYQEQSARYNNFVPLRGWREGPAKDLRYHKGQGFGKSLQHAEGRTSLAENPLAYMESVAFKAISEQVDNEVRREMLNLLLDNWKVKGVQKLVRQKQAYYIKVYDAMGNWEWDIARDPVTDELIKPDQSLIDSGEAKVKVYSNHEKLRTSAQAREHEVWVRTANMDVVLVFDSKNKDMLEVAHAFNHNNTMFKYMFSKNVGDANNWNKPLASTIGILNNWQKAMYTSFNVVFPFTNFGRDVQEGTLTQWIKGESGAKVLKNYKNAFPAIVRGIQGKTDPANNKYDELYERFYMTGGPTGYTHSKDIQQIERELEKTIKDLTNKGTIKGTVGRNARHLIRNVETWNRLFEDATRFSIFMSAVESGKTDKEAASMAKEATVNFNRKGKITKAFDSVWAFFNVSLESMFKNFGLARKYPARFAMVAGGYAAAGFFVTLMNDMLPGDDDDDYYNVSDYARRNYLIIPNIARLLVKGEKGDKYLRLPLPQFWRGFYSAGSLLYDVVVNKKETPLKAAGIGLSNFMAGLLPVDVTGVFSEEGVSFSPIAPTVTKPVVEMLENRNFMGQKIYNEPFTLAQQDRLANAGLGKSNVNQAIKFFTDLAFIAGGGEKETYLKKKADRDGMSTVSWLADWNPSKIEHILKGYSGGTGGVITDAVTTAIQIADPNTPTDFRNMPFINAFIRKVPEAKWGTIREYQKIKSYISDYPVILSAYRKDARLSGNTGKYVNAYRNPFLQEYLQTIKVYDNVISNLAERVDYKTGEGMDEMVKVMNDAINKVNAIKDKYDK